MKLDKAKVTLLFQKEIHELPVLLYYHAVHAYLEFIRQ